MARQSTEKTAPAPTRLAVNGLTMPEFTGLILHVFGIGADVIAANYYGPE